MLTMLSPEYVRMASERTQNIKASIGTLRFMKLPEDKIKDVIMQQYDLSPTYAQNFLDDDSDPEDSRPEAI